MMPFIGARIQGLKRVVAAWEERTEDWKIDFWGYIVIPGLLFLMLALITAPYWLSNS